MRSKYDSHVKNKLQVVKGWRQEGYNEEQIAGLLGVAYSTFMEYKKKYPELLEVLSTSKEHLIDELKKTVYQIALGSTKKVYVKNHRTGKMELEREEYNPTKVQLDAALIALKRLDPDGGWDNTAKEDTGTSVLEKAAENFKIFSEELKKSLEND